MIREGYFSEKLSNQQKFMRGREGYQKLIYPLNTKWVTKYLGPRIHGSDLSRNFYSTLVSSGIPNP